ncbi:hypothetical protein XENOCAPTIV_029446 [Xenoophorus captivus]|uniref:Uncharacterized protein n=1 Tax=Xenoophorus captivus TaxID=1517983 RepID=A0ABV0QY58_9TELE
MSAMRVDAKVVMLGKESVGKTSLVERYVHHRFLVGPYQNVSVSCFAAISKSDLSLISSLCAAWIKVFGLRRVLRSVVGHITKRSNRNSVLPRAPRACRTVSIHHCLVFNSSFSLLLQTIGAAFVAKPIQVGDKVITLGIWDTAGSERYEAMSRIYYRGARAAVVCYGKSTQSSQMTCEELLGSFLINHPTANSRASS